MTNHLFLGKFLGKIIKKLVKCFDIVYKLWYYNSGSKGQGVANLSNSLSVGLPY